MASMNAKKKTILEHGICRLNGFLTNFLSIDVHHTKYLIQSKNAAKRKKNNNKNKVTCVNMSIHCYREHEENNKMFIWLPQCKNY